jgi:hypothetical protein
VARAAEQRAGEAAVAPGAEQSIVDFGSLPRTEAARFIRGRGTATVGSPPPIVNAICDALAPFGVRHVDMPCTPSRVWDAMQGQGEQRR